ncbi:hypothetical protein NC653_032299 [Populus alba x Populus x berolinensis]|uniref:Uncharacterized protein n=1 Tax=Populus alba x Populus x berolinensis TaxID=444605 RepID=A0AAD6PXW2_9ROSI|nr:hypothetical protein NC653_032299 [Populus alba x Populus x berolinensis]
MVKKEETRVVWVLTTVVLWMLVYEVGEGWRDYGSRLVDFGDLGLILGGCMVSAVGSIRSRVERRLNYGLVPDILRVFEGDGYWRLVLGGRLSRARGSANSALQLWVLLSANLL